MRHIIGPIIFLAIIVIVVVRKSRYYRKVFTDDHFGEIARWASRVIEKHPVVDPSEEDGTAFLTSAGLTLLYTSEVTDGDRVVHFSVSQRTGYTTHAVGNRVLFLLIRLLRNNKCEANLFRTQSSVHHAVFTIPADTAWAVESAEAVVRDLENCPELPIENVELPQPGASTNAQTPYR